MQHFRGNYKKNPKQLSQTPVTNTFLMGDVTVMGYVGLYCCYRVFTTAFLFSRCILNPCMVIFIRNNI